MKEFKKSRWTKEEDDILKKCVTENMTIAKIQQELPNRTRNALICRKRILFPEKVQSTLWTEEKVSYLQFNHLSKTPKCIAKEIGISYSLVIEKLKALGLYEANAGYQTWDEKEVEYLKSHYLSESYSYIARKLKRTTSSVQQKANLLGLNKPKPRRWTEEDVAYIKENYTSKTILDLVEKLNRPKHSIYNKAYELGLEAINKDKKEQETLFVLMSAEGKTDGEIADELNCSIDKVAGIRKEYGIFKTPSMCASENRIERMVREEIEKYALEFQSHPSIGDYIPDFYIPLFNLIIEVQGDYWHCNPKIYPDGPKNSEQLGYIVKDYYKKCYYIGNGYNLLYLWEDDILNNFSFVQEEIKQSLKLPSPEETLVMMNAELSGDALPLQERVIRVRRLEKYQSGAEHRC